MMPAVLVRHDQILRGAVEGHTVAWCSRRWATRRSRTGAAMSYEQTVEHTLRVLDAVIDQIDVIDVIDDARTV